jgi:hypothetical protein
VPLWTVSQHSSARCDEPLDGNSKILMGLASLTNFTVKFDTAKLPPILNSLQTENNGQKLVLEVAVRALHRHHRRCCQDRN